LVPLEPEPSAPEVVRLMCWAGKNAGVGPFAAVAGAVAELVGLGLLGHTEEVVVENGGDIFMQVKRKRVVAVYAGDSPFSGTISMAPLGQMAAQTPHPLQ